MGWTCLLSFTGSSMTRTDYLFVRPSFFRGMARVLDIAGTLRNSEYNISSTPEESDAKAILNDWLMVGQDLAEAFDTVGERIERSEPVAR